MVQCSQSLSRREIVRDKNLAHVKSLLLIWLTAAILFLIPNANLAKACDLGIVSSFAAFAGVGGVIGTTPGSSSSCTQIVTIPDNTLSFIACSPDITIESDARILLSNTGMAIITDNGDLSPAVNSTDITMAGTYAGEYMFTRTWIATDGCDNSPTYVQLISVLDDTPPLITIVRSLLASNGDTAYIQCHGQGPQWISLNLL